MGNSSQYCLRSSYDSGTFAGSGYPCLKRADIAALFLTIVNGIGSPRWIFWVNIVVICANLPAAAFLLAGFRMRLVGAALHLLVYWFLFRRGGYFRAGERFRPDWTLTAVILRDSLPIALQNLFCTAGYLIVTLQTNRLLPSDYITVLNVSLPLTGMMSAITSAGLAFLPPNFAAVLIPRCGVLGRSISYPLGWLAAVVFLLAAYWSAGKRCAKIDARKV